MPKKKQAGVIVKLGSALRLEPVLLGKAVAATIDLVVLASSLSDGMKAAFTVAALGWIGWAERLLSTPTVKAEADTAQAHAAGRDSMAADIASLAPAD